MQLTQLRTVEQQMQQGFESGEIGEEQYRGFRREIINAESRLKRYDATVQVNHFGEKQVKECKRTEYS